MLGNPWSDAVLGTDREWGTGDAPGGDASSRTNTVPSVAPGTRAWAGTGAVSGVDAALGSDVGALPQTCAALGTNTSHGPALHHRPALLRGPTLPCTPIFPQNQDGKQVHQPHTAGLRHPLPSTPFTGAALAIKPQLINAHPQHVPREGLPTPDGDSPGTGYPWSEIILHHRSGHPMPRLSGSAHSQGADVQVITMTTCARNVSGAWTLAPFSRLPQSSASSQPGCP